jgi:CheY-like chemotaxis protein
MTTPSDPPAPGTELDVLVVDDDEAVLNVLATGLTALGFRVRCAGHGMQGVDEYKRQRADVVLLDVRMPGLDGPLTLQALQRLDPAVRVIFMTGYAADYAPEDLLGLGAVGFLTKPFGLADLAGALRLACGVTG